jgi:PAS domain S-box-containing protein
VIIENRFVSNTGTIWTRWTNRAVAFDDAGNWLLAQSTGIDITEGKLAEEALAAAHHKLQAIIDNATAIIYAFDLEERFVLANAAVAALFNTTPRQMIGKRRHEFMPKEDADRHEANDREAIAAGRALEFEEQSQLSRSITWLTTKFPLRDPQGRIYAVAGISTDITERKIQEERIKLLLREVNHRSKNLLALVQAVARQTAAANPEEFLESFSERVQALARSQDLLVDADWKGVGLAELVRLQLAHFGGLIGSGIKIRGPSLLVSASASQTLGMAIHELATNAGKYGALSIPEGRVTIAWGLEANGAGGGTFTMRWRERGGPPVAPPSRSGFGSTVIGRLVEGSLDAKVDLDFLSAGLSWRLRCPAAGVVEGTHYSPKVEVRPECDASASSCPKVLVVEDEALVAMEIAHVLKEAGFEVLGPARSVALALSLIDENGCDAAVLDINLGGETSEAIAQKLLAKGARFVTLSGYSRAQHPSIFDGVPALAKPLRPELLIAEVKRCLASKEHRQHEI